MQPDSKWLTVHPEACKDCKYHNALKCIFDCEFYTEKALESLKEENKYEID